ncbi:pseudouridine 5'-phosphatase [Aureococcus anophagefferens]|uniref:Pseudouridine 5'-phosphatase n=1 Tax=Aureococcus anophagefferens TaxID=44056 RepID=A0ABR1GDE6_AURAN
MAELEASAGAAAPAPAPERISIDAVIFDLDGTLLDYEGLSHELLKAPLEARGVEGFTWDLQASIVGSRPERWSEQILEALDVPRDVLTPEAYVADYMAELEGRYGEIEPIAGAQKLVDALLARGVPLALATSTPRASFDKKMAHHPELLYAMSAVVTGGDDSPLGIRGARAAGCFTVALPDARMPANAARLAGLRPTFVCDRAADFDQDARLDFTKRGALAFMEEDCIRWQGA